MTKIEPHCIEWSKTGWVNTFHNAPPKDADIKTKLYTEAQMRQLGEACAALLENQKYMVLNPLRTFTPDEVCRGKKETALYLADVIRRLIKEMLG